ncbi:hypothetical protein BDW68DRAFT_192120 [Aspergillus falconensis]
MPQEPVANFTRVINLDEHDNKEIKQAIIPQTAEKYHRSLMIFDRFLELHPTACSPPDIKTYKGFLEFYARNTPGRIKEKPTIETVENFRRDFETTLARMRDFCVPKAMSINMKELWCRDFKEYHSQYPDQSRVQLTASILLHCFSSAQTGEVHESTARRSIARQKDNGDDNDTKPWASVMAAYYKHFILTIELVDGIPMLLLTYAREFVKGYWRMKKWEPPIHTSMSCSSFPPFQIYTEILDEVDSIKPSDLNLQTNHIISRIHF